MLRLSFLLCVALAAWGQYVPNQYIVEFEDGAVQPATNRSAEKGYRVKARMRRVANAMVVEMEEGQAPQRSAFAKVKRIHKVRIFRPTLDRAASVHALEAAWRQTGQRNAGAGVKIGIIDTGIEITHPGFSGEGLEAPPGYPKGDAAYTNAKVIVARSYPQLWQRRDPDNTPNDRIGHGTAVAMAAGGALHEGPVGTISGMAPGAYLGVYKIFGSPGVNDGATDAAILQAIEDAVADGMDIINLSLGSILAPRPEDDIIVQALERAAAAGVIAVVAAGNEGPGFATLASPATAPSALSVGGNENSRVFASAVEAGGVTVKAMTGSRTDAQGSVSGLLVSIRSEDPSELACTALAAESLRDRIALIQRGTCTFETKILNAAAAGARAAVVYSDEAQPEDFFTMETGRATLPAVMVNYADGRSLLERAGDAGAEATLRLAPQAFEADPNRLVSFSSQGPLPGVGLKPDLLAVGSGVLTAAQSNTPAGDIYSTSRYALLDGTSFSAPIAAGALAALKSARPGLDAAAYRALLVQGSRALANLPLAQQGAGVMHLEAALGSTVLMNPVSVSFAANAQTVTLRSLSAEPQIFQLNVEARKGTAPQWSSSTVELGASGEATLELRLDLEQVPAGTHEGYVTLAAPNGTVLRMPYWYGKARAEAKQIQIVTQSTTARTGAPARDLILFRVLDENGLTLAGRPEVTAVSGGGSVVEVEDRSGDVAGALGLQLVLARGTNTFEINAGNGVTARVSFLGL